MWLASQKIWIVEELETLPSGTKPRTSHHRSPEEERRPSLKGWERAIVNEMNVGTVSQANLWEMGWSAYWLIRAHRFQLEFTWYTDHYQTRSSNQAIHWKLDCWWYMCCLSIILMQSYMKIQIWFKMNRFLYHFEMRYLLLPLYIKASQAESCLNIWGVKRKK